jgi:hypothetical protein
VHQVDVILAVQYTVDAAGHFSAQAGHALGFGQEQRPAAVETSRVILRLDQNDQFVHGSGDYNWAKILTFALHAAKKRMW